MNLRPHGMVHLTGADPVARLKEHDLRALKRLDISTLRPAAPPGRKVLWNAGIKGQTVYSIGQVFSGRLGQGFELLSISGVIRIRTHLFCLAEMVGDAGFEPATYCV
jgi:hypothetical protein